MSEIYHENEYSSGEEKNSYLLGKIPEHGSSGSFRLVDHKSSYLLMSYPVSSRSQKSLTSNTKEYDHQKVLTLSRGVIKEISEKLTPVKIWEKRWRTEDE